MAVGDWTPEAAAAIALCETWASQLVVQIPSQVYLFGSAIYDGGDQFDPQLSDLDIVVWFQDSLDATERALRLTRLREHKLCLELQMVPTLHRTNCQDPGASFLPLTTLEIQSNIHKSGSRRFFDRNIYRDLLDKSESIGLPSAGLCSATDDARQALELVQSIRNKFLAISANRTGGLSNFDAGDPIPKPLARAAAQLLPEMAPGAWYDTRFGLDYLSDVLSRRKTESEEIEALHRKISVRRGGRGTWHPLLDFDQVLLAEILYDIAAAFPAEPVVTWQVHFSEETFTPAKRDQVLASLRDLVPDAEIVEVVVGSLLIKLRSSKRSYSLLLKLYELGVLPSFFGAKKVDVRVAPDKVSEGDFSDIGVIDRIARHIANWRPRSIDHMRENEADLSQWLHDWLQDEATISEQQVLREVYWGEGDRPLTVDIVVRYRENEELERIVVEVIRLRNRSTFFHQIDRVRSITAPVIFVVVGTPDQLENLDTEFKKLSVTDGAIRIVPVQLDNG